MRLISVNSWEHSSAVGFTVSKEISAMIIVTAKLCVELK